MAQETKTMTIVLKYPASVSWEEITDYAQSALEYWGGQRHPDDHLFNSTKAPKSQMKSLKAKRLKHD